MFLELRIFRQVNGEVLKKPALITSSREIYKKYRKTSVSSFELSNWDDLKSTSWKIMKPAIMVGESKYDTKVRMYTDIVLYSINAN